MISNTKQKVNKASFDQGWELAFGIPSHKSEKVGIAWQSEVDELKAQLARAKEFARGFGICYQFEEVWQEIVINGEKR